MGVPAHALHCRRATRGPQPLLVRRTNGAEPTVMSRDAALKWRAVGWGLGFCRVSPRHYFALRTTGARAPSQGFGRAMHAR